MSEKEQKKQRNQQHYYKTKIIEKCQKFHERVGDTKISLKFALGRNKERKINFEPREIQGPKPATGIDYFIKGIKSLGRKFVDANPNVQE